jgi:septal ring factor EnvC (AmiA/AmiB activator)
VSDNTFRDRISQMAVELEVLKTKLDVSFHAVQTLCDKTDDIKEVIIILETTLPFIKKELDFLSRKALPAVQSEIQAIQLKTTKNTAKLAIIVSIITALISSGALTFILQ